MLTMATGFVLSALAYWCVDKGVPAKPVMERIVPFAAAFAVALGVGRLTSR